MRHVFFLIAVSCTVETDDEKPLPHGLPEHTECFDEKLEDDVCLELIAEHDQQPTNSFNQSDIAPMEDDPRLTDPDYMWLTEEIQKCACACCHNSTLQGSGSFFWDISFSPVWIDSANSWSLTVLAGETEEPDQTIPVEDVERLLSVINQERERRR